NTSGDLLSQAQTIKGRKDIAARGGESDPKRMLELADQPRDPLGSGIVVLAGAHDGQVRLLAAVTKDLAGQVHAGKLVGEIAPIVGGKGGGRPEAGQGGGREAGKD